ncbi:hypothetical protein [Planktothrix mougeotii]|uniref:Uncharacterized protein n=1 Tax=Planktothrix mougeotii LEGE 06226 TaxID=1828728 RepID=A0ABR9U6A5_9CYAN|nr:hypothetical protein [Planktothrix mougeotii]MBE9141947.1 hypothetical protein [Planktothrix mougeotii LEGE 06226]
MSEVALLSLMVSSLGIDAVLLASWLCSIQTDTQLEQEEEETLTRYDSEDTKQMPVKSIQPNGYSNTESPEPLVRDWEYKIVRASRDVFRNPTIFKRLCQEEAEMGWILVEKLDDRRVRFKRPRGLDHAENPYQIKADPYRSTYGSSSNLGAWLTVIAFITAIILPAYLGFSLVAMSFNKSYQNSSPTISSPEPEVPSASP